VHVSMELSSQTDTQTYTHTDVLITILCNRFCGQINKLIMVNIVHIILEVLQ